MTRLHSLRDCHGSVVPAAACPPRAEVSVCAKRLEPVNVGLSSVHQLSERVRRVHVHIVPCPVVSSRPRVGAAGSILHIAQGGSRIEARCHKRVPLIQATLETAQDLTDVDAAVRTIRIVQDRRRLQFRGGACWHEVRGMGAYLDDCRQRRQTPCNAPQPQHRRKSFVM